MDSTANQAGKPPEASIHSLPDALLGHVLAMAGLSERASVALVSHRFRRVLYGEPALWRSLRIGRWYVLPPAGADHGIFKCLLHHVLGMVQEISVDMWTYAAAEFVALLQPGALASVQPIALASLQLSDEHPAATGASPGLAAAGLTALTRLMLRCNNELPSNVPAALGSLPRLSSLVLISDDWVASPRLAPALRRLAPHLVHLELGVGQLPRAVAAAVGTLSSLRRLGLWPRMFSDEASHALSALAQLTALETLWVSSLDDSPQPGADLAAMFGIWTAALEQGRFGQLLTLTLRVACPLPPALVRGLACQSQLTGLQLDAQLGDVRQLSRLKRLCYLQLRDEKVDASTWQEAQLPPPSSFSDLEGFDFYAGYEAAIVGGTRLKFCACGDESKMEWIFGRWFYFSDPPPAVDTDSDATLIVRCTEPLFLLDQLLQALLRPDVPLHVLDVSSEVTQGAVMGSQRIGTLLSLQLQGSPGILGALPQQLPQLSSLSLTGTAPAASLQPDQLPSLPALEWLDLRRHIDGSGGSSIDAWMPALLARAPQLTGLVVAGHLSAEGQALARPLVPPAWLSSLTGIRRLSLEGNRLAHLPADPYLAGLAHLNLRDNVFLRLPHSLEAATGLTYLSLQNNSSLIVLTDDVDRVLARMPGLQELNLHGCPRSLTPAVQDRLLQLPGLLLS